MLRYSEILEMLRWAEVNGRWWTEIGQFNAGSTRSLGFEQSRQTQRGGISGRALGDLVPSKATTLSAKSGTRDFSILVYAIQT